MLIEIGWFALMCAGSISIVIIGAAIFAAASGGK